MFAPFFGVAVILIFAGYAMLVTFGNPNPGIHNAADQWGCNMVLSGAGGLVTGALTWLLVWVAS